MSKVITINTTNFRRELSDILEKDDIVIISMRDKPVAVIVPFGDISDSEALRYESLIKHNPTHSIHQITQALTEK